MPRTRHIYHMYIYNHPLDNHMDFLWLLSTEICWYFYYSCSKLTSHACTLLIDNVGNYLYLNNGSFKSEGDPYQFSLREKKRDFQKLAGLWLAGKMVNRIGIYRSKVAEGLSAFQRPSCDNFQCSQWWKFYQDEDIFISVMEWLYWCHLHTVIS